MGSGNLFYRVIKKEDDLVFETAIKTYTNIKKDLEIKLAGICHIGKKNYFLEIFNKMAPLEKILFEYAASGKLTRKQESSKVFKMIKEYSEAMENYAYMHGLCLQAEVLPTYGFRNWELCDMLIGKFLDKLAKSPEDIEWFKEQIKMINHDLKIVENDLTQKEKNFYLQTKLLENYQEEEIERIPNGVIFTYREKIVKKRLKTLVHKKEAKKTGLVYGSKHMPTFVDFLENLNFRLKDEKWLEVWRVRDLKE